MQMPVLVEEMRPESFYDLQRIDKTMEGNFLQNCFDDIKGNKDSILCNLEMDPKTRVGSRRKWRKKMGTKRVSIDLAGVPQEQALTKM
jgi:hypothetical protein